MKSKFIIFIISFILPITVLHAQPNDKSLVKKLAREKPLDLAAGILSNNNIERDTIIDGYHETAIDTTIVDNPPKLGDVARIVCTKPFHSGDRFCLQTQQVASRLATKDDLSQVKVVPNPYLVSAGWELHGEDHRIAFTHLPAKCEIIIFNVTGEVVAILKHDDLHSGATFWNLQSHEGMEVASGLYLYVVKTQEGKKKDGKFVVIR